jgi:two-component system LytT family response regulator
MAAAHPIRPAVWKDHPLSVVIADDDRECLQKTKDLLAAEPNVHVVAECAHTGDIDFALRAYQPDLVLLDPQIPGGSPLELFARMRARLLPLLIFITAQDQYALKAFEARAFDFILKPFGRERFRSSIERARADVARLKDGYSKVQVHPVGRPAPSLVDRLIVKSAGRVVFLEYDEVDWIEAAANYVNVHAGNQVYRLRAPIGEVERQVARHSFSRIHRSVIVNVKKIKEVQPCNSGEYMVRLRGGKELACSRGYSASIRALVNGGFEPLTRQ